MPQEIALIDALADLPDPRTTKNLRYPLTEVVTIAICAVMSGAESFRDIELFGRCNQEWFGSFLRLENGIPSHDTIGRVFQFLDCEAFREFFGKWSSGLATLAKKEVVALDGKRLRNSLTGAGPLTMVSAWACENGITLGCDSVSGSEVSTLPTFIKQLYLKGCIVTIDAAGCQRSTAESILAQRADYVLSVKRNQPRLFEAIEDLFNEWDNGFPLPVKTYQTNEKGHGRETFRRYSACGETSSIPSWPGLRSIGRVETIGKGSEEVQVRYFASSLPASAINLERATRSHWRIENSSHWVLDVEFNEDRYHIRRDQGAQNMAILRRLSLNLLKSIDDRISLKGRRKKCGWDRAYLLKALST